MALSITVTVERELDIERPYDDVFAYLADVPKCATNFPNVDQLIDLGEDAYRWEMKKVGIDKYSIQSVYAVKYSMNKKQGVIKWEPVAGVGNGVVEGSWKIKKQGDSTHLTFYSKGVLSLPFPKLTKMIVGPFVVREFTSIVDKYLKNLKNSLQE